MVATTIFLGVSIVVFSTLGNYEGHKRATTSVNDIDQEGSYALYELGLWIRSSGSGFARNYLQSYGCKLNVIKSSNTILPAPAAFPNPFSAVGQTLRLAPAIIYSGASQSGSDVIAVMSGSGGFEQVSQNLQSVPTSSALNPAQAHSVNPNDLLLVTDFASSGLMSDCLIEQVSGSYTAGSTPISLAGTYYTSGPSASGTKQLSGYSVSGTYTGIGTYTGTVTTSNVPTFLLIGVGPTPNSSNTLTTPAQNNSLFIYDVLQTGGLTVSVPIADNVLEMHALYGVDTNGDGIIDTWEAPTTTTGYDSGTLTNGSTTSAAILRSIKAIRVGLILRTDIAEKSNITESQPVLFQDLGSSLQYPPSTAAAYDTHYRYRTLESTIPVRNNYLN